MGNTKKLICSIILLCCVLLFSCAPDSSFLKQQGQGLYPNTSNFPNTKWMCREIDLCIYMFGYEEASMIGCYEVNSVSYRVIATFEFDTFNLDFYSSTDVSLSEHSDSMVHCKPNSCGYIYTSYFFDKDTETIVCSIRNCMPVDTETIPETLTFEQVGSIAQNPNVRWCAQEIDMYLDSFIDVNGYLSGEISLGGEKHYIHALEIGNSSYFMLTIENGKLNNLRPETTSPLIYMYFEIDCYQINAIVCDTYLSNTEAFPYWTYEDTIITFKPCTFEDKK